MSSKRVSKGLTLDELLKLRFARLGNEGLFQQNLVYQSIDVRAKTSKFHLLGRKVQQIDRFSLNISV